MKKLLRKFALWILRVQGTETLQGFFEAVGDVAEKHYNGEDYYTVEVHHDNLNGVILTGRIHGAKESIEGKTIHEVIKGLIAVKKPEQVRKKETII